MAKRYKLPLSAILVRRPALLDLQTARRAAEALPVVLGLRKLIRDVDVLGHYRTDDSFLLVLPQTSRPGAEVLANRIEQTMSDLIVVTASNEDGIDSSEVLLQMLQVLAFDLQEA